MIRNVLLAAIAAAVFLASPAFPAEPTPKAGPELEIQKETFEARDGRKVEAERGSFQVPENRRTPSGKTLRLTFVRFPSTAAKPGPPIVYLAGGPGGSGIATAQGSRFDLFQELRAVADVIAFDQRGTGESEGPPPCSKGWTLPFGQAGTRAAYEAAVTEAAEFCAQEWRQAGVDLDAYNTEESADDLEALRQALGVPKISLWSISYGTHLAMSTLRRHPDSIERVILAGPEGPDHTLKLPADSQAQLRRIADRLAADGLKEAFPDFLGDVKTVLAQLEKKPTEVPLPGGETMLVGPFDVQLLAAGMLTGPELQRYLPGAFQAMSMGIYAPLAPFLPRVRSGEIGAMSAAMDTASGISEERRRLIAQQAEETLLGDAINFPWEPVAKALKVRDLGPAFRAPLKTRVPALFISGTDDVRTPLGNTEDLLPGFENAHHLILEGAGHSDPLFLGSPQILDVMRAFLEGKDLPEKQRLTVPYPPWPDGAG